MPSMGFFFCLFLLAFPSCRNSGDIAAVAGEIPDTVSENFRQVTVSSTGRIEIESQRVETFAKKELTVFSEASVKEFDAEGTPTLEGRADHIETEGGGEGHAHGDIFIHDIPGEFRLEAERLEWNDKERLLTGVGPVDIETGDGLTVRGEGFTADMARETFSFSEGAEGTLTSKDSKDSEGKDSSGSVRVDFNDAGREKSVSGGESS